MQFNAGGIYRGWRAQNVLLKKLWKKVEYKYFSTDQTMYIFI